MVSMLFSFVAYVYVTFASIAVNWRMRIIAAKEKVLCCFFVAVDIDDVGKKAENKEKEDG